MSKNSKIASTFRANYNAAGFAALERILQQGTFQENTKLLKADMSKLEIFTSRISELVRIILGAKASEKHCQASLTLQFQLFGCET